MTTPTELAAFEKWRTEHADTPDATTLEELLPRLNPERFHAVLDYAKRSTGEQGGH